jgi:hypothetical protein
MHASNDYSTAAGRALAAERERQHRPVLLKIYPPVGESGDDGHNFIYGATNLWEQDVISFLNQNLKP